MYIVVEGEDPGFDIFVNGRALARHEDALERLALKLGVRPLIEFFSADENSMALLIEEGGGNPELMWEAAPSTVVRGRRWACDGARAGGGVAGRSATAGHRGAAGAQRAGGVRARAGADGEGWAAVAPGGELAVRRKA